MPTAPVLRDGKGAPTDRELPDGPSRRRLSLGAMITVVVVVALMALLVYGVLAQAPNTTIDDALTRHQKTAAPGFNLPVLARGDLPPRLAALVDDAAADGRVRLSELRGAPILLNFWASWCVPCQEEAPLLERGWRDARRGGILLVGLDMQDATEDARAFLRRFDVTYLNVRDKQKDAAIRWGATGVPESYFISAEGDVVGHVVGKLSPRQLKQGIAAATSGQILGAIQGGASRKTR